MFSIIQNINIYVYILRHMIQDSDIGHKTKTLIIYTPLVERSDSVFEITENLELPQQELESLARCLLPEILSFFESEEGKKEFEEWKKGKEK